jgi:hypothetical protein
MLYWPGSIVNKILPKSGLDGMEIAYPSLAAIRRIAHPQIP